MPIKLHPFYPSGFDHAAPDATSSGQQQASRTEVITTVVATSIGVLMVALIAVLMGMT